MMNDPRSASRSRFRHEQSALAAALRSLLGQAADALEFMGPERAGEIDAEFLESHRAADEYGASVVENFWPEAEIEKAVGVIHRLARHVGARPVWLIVPLSDPQAVAMPNELPLDNPLGFAALADSELRLLDHELPAGLWFLRHTHHLATNHVEYTWELSVWGEPWASAATGALRGAG
jgi:hypothetical protein